MLGHLRGGFSRLWGYVAARRADEEFQQELADHLERLTEENIRRGMSPKEAARSARLRLGNTSVLRETHRDLEGLPMLDAVAQDFRYAIRMLRKRPGFTAIAMLTLALGIGANTAMFSVINAVFLQPLPFRDANRIYLVHRAGNRFGGASISMPIFLEWKKRSAGVFEHLALFGSRGSATVTGRGEPERIPTAGASVELFSVLHVQPALGRDFRAEETRPGGANVAILSDAFWRRRFQRDPGALGTSITIDGEPHTIIGVLPADFEWPLAATVQPDLWLPIRVPLSSTNPSNGGLLCLGLLKSDATRTQAEQVLTPPLGELRQQFPNMFMPEERAFLEPLRTFISSRAGTAPLLMGGAVALVLLIACLNIANLTLAASTSRQREIAVRAAMGAGRRRIVRQLLTESVVLAIAGGIVGLLVCYASFDVILSLVPASTPHVGSFGIDRNVMLFAMFLSLVTGLLFGLFPALRASGLDANAILKNANPRAGSSGQERLRRALAANEVAISLVLLIGAALALQSFYRLTHVQPGFGASTVLTFRVEISPQKYPSPDARQAFFDALLDRTASLPGVQRSAVVNVLPFRGGSDTLFSLEDRLGSSQSDRGAANVRRISPDYFAALGIPIQRGRALGAQDQSDSAPVVVINRAMAQAYWPDTNPIGQRIWIGRPMGPANTEPASRQIVGVVSDIREASLARAPEPTLYIPYAQSPSTSGGSFIVQTMRPPATLAADVRAAVHALDQDLPVTEVREMSEVVSFSAADWRFRAILLVAFAVVALFIAVIGVYGVISYSVAQRTQEIGVRMALGAVRRDVLALVVWQGMRTTLTGIAIGLIAAYGLTRLITSLLFDVSPTDPVTFGGLALLLSVVGLAACLAPARRALRIDPMAALKHE